MNTQFINFYKNKKVFLTGHTGFKGSWMLVLLQILGAKVKGYSLKAPEKSLFNDIKENLECESVIADIRDKTRLLEEVQSFQPDIIIHMAAQPLVLDSYKNPVYTYEVNAIGTANLLEATKSVVGKCVVINITTDKVYENKEWIYSYRENDALGGYDPYSASKACSEIITASYRSSFFNPDNYNNHQKAIATARAGNVIGGGDWAENRIIPDIIRAVTNDEKLLLRNPTAVRPWQHVLEALYGYLLLAINLDSNPGIFSDAFNFGPLYDESVTVEHLVKKAIHTWKKGDYYIEPQSIKLHEAKLLRLDCSKAVNLLKWTPQWSAEDAIQKTINWYKDVIENKNSPFLVTKNQILEYY
jgi:CDP-glucose 4,6-dehydratase